MKSTFEEKCIHAISVIIVVFVAIVTLYPYINQIAIALNDALDTSRGGVTIYPRKFTLENFKTILTNLAIYKGAIISVTRVVIGGLLAFSVTFSAGYALSRSKLKGRKFFTWYLCIPMYISAGLIPSYFLLRELHLINNYFVYILPTCFSFYNMIIIRSFIQDLPASIEESALLDGANEIYVMFKIILPISMPVVATICLWLAVGYWNDWTTTLYYVTNPNLYPLQYVMMQIIKQSEIVQQMQTELSVSSVDGNSVRVTTESLQSAVLIVSTLPIIMLYPFVQKYFVKGVTLGAVKE